MKGVRVGRSGGLLPILLSGKNLSRLYDIALFHIRQQLRVLDRVAKLRISSVEQVLA